MAGPLHGHATLISNGGGAIFGELSNSTSPLLFRVVAISFLPLHHLTPSTNPTDRIQLTMSAFFGMWRSKITPM